MSKKPPKAAPDLESTLVVNPRTAATPAPGGAPPAPAAGADADLTMPPTSKRPPTPAAGEPRAQTPSASKMPSTIGRYQVLERVGRGGMGVLYRGVDPVLDREVAIKLMLADFSEDAEQMRPRFYREARSVAKLQHRNIVTVFEFAEEGTTPFIVMEFLRGTSLAQRLEMTPPLTLDDKLDVIIQLCAGLSYAHGQGVVHRDVKPANVFLLTDTTVKLLDFGIAKVTTSNLTRQGDVLGSASYMSPEQVMGSDSVDGRADIFSTGVMLYELLSGRRPFEGDAATAIVMKILNEAPPPIDTVVPGLPPQLAAIVGRALQKDPANRFASAADFARELQVVRRALQAGGSTEPPAAAGHRKWMVPAGIAAAVVVVATAALLVRPAASLPDSTGALRGAASAPATAQVPAPATAVTAPAGEAPAAPAPAPASAAPKGPASPAPAFAASLQVSSDPEGATISLDGRDTRRMTPASIAIGGAGPHRLRLSKPGFQPRDARLADADLKSGAVSYKLQEAEAVAAITASITGAYAFEVFDGTKLLSAAGPSHELKLPAGRRIRLVAAGYFLDHPVTIEATPDRHVDIQAPGLGKLTIRSALETCRAKIGDHDLGNPPINNVPIAAGAYTIDLVCPNGQSQRGFTTVTPGQTAMAKIP